MFRTASYFDKLLDKATSNLLLEPDWPTTLQICDLIRQNDVQPKNAIIAIKKKLFSQNPHCAMFALQVLESIVKNCGSSVHNEVASKDTCEMFHELAKTSPHENVRQKVLELIQAWAFAFRNQPKYRAVQDIVNIMKAEGYKFPALKESDAMFSANSAPEWSDGAVCHRCRVTFSIMQRKHHCRACGQVFCAQCSQRTATLPKFGIEKEVRVCDACYETLNKPTTAVSKAAAVEGDLPAEYVSSSLAQQNQAPPRKTEEELREEEELQLALALSQSEAEHKEEEKKRITSFSSKNTRVYSPPPTVDRSPSPKNEDSMDPELARYLNRSYWEQRQTTTNNTSDNQLASPSAPSQQQTKVLTSPPLSPATTNNISSDDPEMDDFVAALKSQVEIFVNRMKSNSSRGRSIANDSSVQTLFMNITAMHSRLLRYIQQQDDDRLKYEGFQDKLAQVKDARAALDALREEHRDKLRREAEEAERQRQLQMAHKLEIMRKKKQEYLQYQRQLALQRIQEQEREMQIRQEQQKQQYLMAPQYPPFMGSPVHTAGTQYSTANPGPGSYSTYPQYTAPPQHMMGSMSTIPAQTNNPALPSSAQGTPIPQPGMGLPTSNIQPGITPMATAHVNHIGHPQVGPPHIQHQQMGVHPQGSLQTTMGSHQSNPIQQPGMSLQQTGQISSQPVLHRTVISNSSPAPGSTMGSQSLQPPVNNQPEQPAPKENNNIDTQNETAELISFD